MTIRGFGRGRSKRSAKDLGNTPSIFANAPPSLSQAELSNNMQHINTQTSYAHNNSQSNTSLPHTDNSQSNFSYNTFAVERNGHQSNGSPNARANNNGFGSHNHNQNYSNQFSSHNTGQFSDANDDWRGAASGGSELTETMCVPERKVGRIIGKGGCTIRELQDDSGAHIDVSRDSIGNEEKEVTIKGSAEAVAKAKDLINELLDDGSNNNNSSNKFDNNSFEASETVRVPENKIGRVIGRGGSQIQEIQDESGAKVDISRDSDGYDKVITISGSPAAIAKAKDLITDIVGLSNERAPRPGGIDYSKPIDWGEIAANEVKYRHDRWGVLPPVEKDFYREPPEIARLSPQQVAQIRAENMGIEVSHYIREEDKDKPEVYAPIANPVLTFEHAFGPYPDILREIYKQGFSEPSPIQKQMWPILLSGHDCIGVAQTGTGKTLGFLLPAFIHIEAQPKPRNERVGPTVFCLAPTRELALQIKWEVDKYTYHGISSACVYGGADRQEQVRKCKKGVDIVVATPGRLNDLIESGILNLDACSYLILDEADRMLDMGFEPQIKKVLLDIRPDRHTIMTSATWPPGVRRIAHEYMNNSIIVNVGTLDLKAACTVTQQIVMTTLDEKLGLLQELIETQIDHTKDKCLIFVGRKVTADFISSEFITRYMRPELQHLKIRSDAIHGDRDQSDREQALGGFKNGNITVLIATDVASRGLDVQGITHVVNYDFPRDMEDYVHRVGRTGRAGREGVAVSLFTREDWRKSGDLVKILSDSQQVVPDELVVMAERWAKKKEQMDREKGRGGGRGGGGGGGGRQRYR